MNETQNQNTRNAIVEASMRLFATRGYHGTSVAQIAKATGLTKGALYWYFKDKQDLFLTVLDRIKENWRSTIMSRVEASDGVIEKLTQLFDATSEMVTGADQPQSMHLFLVAAGAQPELHEFENAIKAAYDGYIKTLTDTLRAGQESGEIRRDIDAESAAVGIIGCLEGIVLQSRLYSQPTIVAAMAEMKQHFLRSLAMTQKRAPRKEVRAPSPADQLNLF